MLKQILLTDETYIKVKGKNAYLYRAVNSKGKTIDFYVSKKRDKATAREFFKKALKGPHNQHLRVRLINILQQRRSFRTRIIESYQSFIEYVNKI